MTRRDDALAPYAEILVAQIQALIDQAIRRSGKTRTAVAAAMGTSLPTIGRTLRKDNFTVRHAARVLAAAGFELRLEIVPIAAAEP